MEKALYFNPADNLTEGVEEISINSWKRVDSFYLKTDRGLTPKAYIYPMKHKNKLEELFGKYRAAKAAFDAIAAQIFYQELPKLEE